MSDKAPGSKPTLRESIGDGAPDFTETLTFVLEIIPVSPLLASPPGVPPIESNAPMPPAIPEPAIPSVPLGPVQRPGSPLLPPVLGAGGPIVLEGHNITHFSLDMATHGFTGEITFRISESRWLGDPKERDRLLRAFQGENILMLKLTIKPVFKDRKFTPYLTPEMVPKPTTLIPRTPYVTNTGKMVPHAVPLMVPQLKLVGMPVNFEEGLLPQALYQPIEMQLTAVLTERAMSEHTSHPAPDVIVSYREYRARFADPAQAIWRQHFPLALYVRKSVKQVVEQHRPGLFSILFKGSDLSKTEDQIFVGCDFRRPRSERASFYDWLMWRVEKARATWEYDYNNNVYRVMRRPERAQPFEIYAEDIGKVITYYPEESRFQEWLLNDYVPAARQAQVPNLQGLTGVWQDHLFHTQVMLEFEAEWLQRISRWKMPDPEFVLHFKRFPMKPFSPGVGLKFDLDPMAFPNEHMAIPREAQRGRQPSRVYRVRLHGESLEDDVSPIYQGRTDGKFKLRLAVWLQSPRDRLGRLPQYIQPRYPVDIEGVIACDNQGSMIYQYYTELLTNIKYYQVRIPLFYNQKVRVPYIPNKDTGHFYFPPYKNERVLVSLYSDRSEIKSFLDWRMTAETPLPTQGNQIVMGRELANGAAMRLWYSGEIPELWLQRYKDESFQYVRLYQSGVEMKSVQGPPQLGRVIAAASKGAGAAAAAGSGQGGVTTIGIRQPVGGGGGTTGERVAAPVRAAAKPGPPTRRDGALPAGPRAPAHRVEPGAVRCAAASRRGEFVEAGAAQVAHAAGHAARAGAAVARAASAAPKVGPGAAPPRPVRTSGSDVAVAERPAARGGKAPAKASRAAAAGQTAAEGRARTTRRAKSPDDAAATGRAGKASRGASARDGRGPGAPRAAGSDGGAAPPSRGGGGSSSQGGPPGGSTAGPGDGGSASSPTEEAPPISPAPLESGLTLDSASGVALGLTDTLGGGVHGLSMGSAGLKMQSRVGAAESRLTQEGDVITLRARELNIDVDTIRVTAKTSASYQSLGQLTVSSLADLTLQTAAAMTQTAMGGLTINTLKLLVSALEAIRLLAASGGVGVVGGGPGVEIFGSNFSATGLRSTLSGVTTDVLGTLVSLGQPGAAVGGGGGAANGLFTGLGAGDLQALAALLQQLSPRPDAPTTHAYEKVPEAATKEPAPGKDPKGQRDKKDKKDQQDRKNEGDTQDPGPEKAASDEGAGEDAAAEGPDDADGLSGGEGDLADEPRKSAGKPPVGVAGPGPTTAAAPQPDGPAAPPAKGQGSNGAKATAPAGDAPLPKRKRRRRVRHRPLAPHCPPAPADQGAEPPVEVESPVALMKKLTRLRAELSLDRTTHCSTVGQVYRAIPVETLTPAEEMDALLTAFEDRLARDGLSVAGLRAAVEGLGAAPEKAEPSPGSSRTTAEPPPPLPVPGLPPAVLASSEALAALFLRPAGEAPAGSAGPGAAESAPAGAGDAGATRKPDAGGRTEAGPAEAGPGPETESESGGAKAAAPAGDVGSRAQGLQQGAGAPTPGAADAAAPSGPIERAAPLAGAVQGAVKDAAGLAGSVEKTADGGSLSSALTGAAQAALKDAAGLAGSVEKTADAAQEALGSIPQTPSRPRQPGDATPGDVAAALAAAAGLGGVPDPGRLAAAAAGKPAAALGRVASEGKAAAKAAEERVRSVEKTLKEAAVAGKGLGGAVKPPAARDLKPGDSKEKAEDAARRALLGERDAVARGAAPSGKEGPQPPAVSSTGAAALAAGLAGAGAAGRLKTGAPTAPSASAPKEPVGASQAPPSPAGPGGKAAGPGVAAGLPLASASKGTAEPGGVRAPELRPPSTLRPIMGPPLGSLGGQRETAASAPGRPPAPGPGGAKAAGATPPGSSAAGTATRLAAAGAVPVPVGIPPAGRALIVVPPSALVVYRVQKAVFDSITALVAPSRPRREDP